MILPSYLRDGWWTPDTADGAADVLDASTGDPIAQVSTTGLDLAGALDHARTVGQRSASSPSTSAPSSSSSSPRP